MKKLNLGCGEDLRSGYVNMDARPETGADVVGDITKKLPFKDKSFTEVLAYDVLEHLIESDLEKVLSEVNRVLTDGGKLIIRTPDIEAIWENFAADPETRNIFLYGETTEQGMWGAHKNGQTLLSLATLLRMQGFRILKHQNKDTNWIIEAEKYPLEKPDVLVTDKPSEVIKNMWIKPVIWIINDIVSNFWYQRLMGLLADEVSVPNPEVYKSLFPRTRISMARVKINQLEYQKKRAYARKLAKIDLDL